MSIIHHYTLYLHYRIIPNFHSFSWATNIQGAVRPDLISFGAAQDTLAHSKHSSAWQHALAVLVEAAVGCSWELMWCEPWIVWVGAIWVSDPNYLRSIPLINDGLSIWGCH